MNMNTNPKLLMICDTPTPDRRGAVTGFGVVARELIRAWRAARPELAIDVWAIGFQGQHYETVPAGVRLIPATEPQANGPWWKQLGGALELLAHGEYTHVWLLNDLEPFTLTDFPAKLRHVCALKKIRSLLYFPVDATLEPEWCDILRRVDVAVAYTDYAARMVQVAGGSARVEVLPHGVSEEFCPEARGDARPTDSDGASEPTCGAHVLPTERKAILKEIIIKPTKNSERPFATAADFVVLGVNKNEWRKDPFRMLQITAGLKAAGVPVKLILRMAPHSAMGGISLETAGRQLGLKLDEDWTHLPPMATEHLVALYQAADLYLTTTLGEGWGLGITEALACGCPVALPGHTACGELVRELLARGVSAGQFVELPPGDKVCGMDSRIRQRVDLAGSVAAISQYYFSRKNQQQQHTLPLAVPAAERPELPAAAREWLSWPRIAAAMLGLLEWKTVVSREGAKEAK